MSLREKQISDQNRLAKVMSIFILASMILITLLAFTQEIRPDVVVRLVVLIVALVVNIVCGGVFRSSETYRHIVVISTFVVKSGISDYLERFAKYITVPLFGVSGKCGMTVLLSMIGGYPVGAKGI